MNVPSKFSRSMQHRIFGPVEQFAQPTDIGEPRACIVPRSLKQQMAGLIFAQHIVNQVGGKGHLFARLALARMLAFDKAGDDGHLAEGAMSPRRCDRPVIRERAAALGR